MSVKRFDPSQPKNRAALNELRELILERFPATTFRVQTGGEPEGIYLIATVELEDPDEITELIIDRVVDMQVEERLPIYVIPIQPLPADIASPRAASRRQSVAFSSD